MKSKDDKSEDGSDQEREYQKTIKIHLHDRSMFGLMSYVSPLILQLFQPLKNKNLKPFIISFCLEFIPNSN